MSIVNTLGRVLVPLVTPFDENFNVDYDQAAKLARSIVSLGYADTVVVSGTTGEFNAMTAEERIKLFEVIKEEIGNKVPIMAGTGAASTREAITITRAAERIGVDAIMVVAPYYCRPTQRGIYDHYKAIAQSTKLPMLLYNIPLFTGVNIDPATVAALAKEPNVVGVKEEAGVNPTQTSDYVLGAPGDFVVYCGDDTMVLPALAQGAVGVVSGGSHIIGDRMKTMISSFLKGKVEEAKRIHLQLYPLFKAFAPNGRVHPNPLLRAAISMVLFPVGYARPPLDKPTEDEVAALRKVIRGLGISLME